MTWIWPAGWRRRFGRWAITIAIAASLGQSLAADAPRERLLLDFNWKFHLGDDWGLAEDLDKAGQSKGPAAVSFNDVDWRSVNLPHDWAVELPFDPKANYDHGYKTIGPDFPNDSVGWYRREFTIPKSDYGRRLWLEFDGVYRDCRVFLNGYRVARREGGYNSFRCDISDVANYGGPNALSVRVDASEFEGWFYEGAGIYRHVWLVKTGSLAIAPDSIFVFGSFKGNVPKGSATIHLETRLVNRLTNAAPAEVLWQVLDSEGETVATAQASIVVEANGESRLEKTTAVASPVLWSPETPALYKLITTVASRGDIVDREETEFGIRTFAFDPDQGFLLNGRHYEIHGTCNHQDHAGVGSALPDALQYFRARRLKEMGCNAVRTSHNEPTREWLEVCDRVGLLVMDENRLLGSDAQNLAYLEEQIRRDRNHPSVFIWSLANEEIVQRSETGARVFATMQDLVHHLDPTRLCTAAMNGWSDGRADGFSTVMDVQGFNYLHQGNMDDYHKSNPTKPIIGTEEASAFYTRGIYENTKTYESAYDDNKPGYGSTAEEWWSYYAARPWASGSFVWTGFDYRGEASPFHWPNINSEFGILDTCGFPKDVFYYYQSWWTDKPVLHLMPHWNWPGKEDQNIDVRAFSNCQEVELFLNGKSLGRKAMPRNSHLQWLVKYEPGVLSAKGYDNGLVTAQTKIETTSTPAAIKLTPDRQTIHADGEDCAVVAVSITDGQGRFQPTADNLLHFALSGPGKIIGVGNGDPGCHEADVEICPPSVRTLALDDWRMKKVTDIKDRRDVGSNVNDSDWPKVNVHAPDGPLDPDEMAVFRTHVHLAAPDLLANRSEINFGMIDDEGWVYVNGRAVGESHNWRTDPSYDVTNFLRPGENTIAVFVKNNEGRGGLNKGAALELLKPRPPITWQRRAFNGLVEVIVQTDKDGGPIQLTASAESLSPGTVVINAEPCLARPAVP